MSDLQRCRSIGPPLLLRPVRLFFLPLLSVLLVGCVAAYRGPSTDRTATVHLRAVGIVRRPGWSDDIVLVELFEKGQSRQKGSRVLTVEAPHVELDLDEAKIYRLTFTSYEGMSNCAVSVEISPLQGDIFQIAYFTSHSSCRVSTRMTSSGQGEYVTLREVAGVMTRRRIQVNSVIPVK